MRAVTKSELAASVPELLDEANQQSILITDEQDRELGVLISMKDYEFMRKARAQSFLETARKMGEEIRVRAEAEGISMEEIARILDRKAPE